MQYKNCTVKNNQLDSAVEKGDVVLARRLLMHPSVNADFSADGCRTVLHKATLNNDVQMVQLLLANGASVDCESSVPTAHISPLWLAVLLGSSEITDVLLKAGADVNRRFGRNHCDEFQYDPKTSLLHVAVANCDGYLAEKLLAAGADPNACDWMGESVLQRAIDTNWHDWIAQLLVEHGARVDHKNHLEKSILHSAVGSASPSLVRLVLRCGADPSSTDNLDKNALHIAAASEKGNREVARMLIEAGVPIDAVDGDRYTPLHLALLNGNEDIALLLLDHGADVHVKTFLGMTPLYLAIEYWDTEMAVELLARGASVHEKNRSGLTMLHSACTAESEAKIRLLLAHGADVNAKDRFGKTPLYKIKRNYSTAAREMIKQIARLHVQDPKLVDQGDIDSIMADETMHRHYDTFAEEIEKMKTIKIYNDFTYHSLFTETADKIVPLLRNEQVLEGLTFVDRASMFPSYSEQLDLKLSKAEERRDFEWAAAECLNEVFQYSLPTIVIDEILRYLQPNDIKLNLKNDVK